MRIHSTSRWRALQRTSQISRSGIASTAAQVAGSVTSPGRNQPSRRWRSSSWRISGHIQLGKWTPLVTWPIGTSSSRATPNTGRHIARDTPPWMRLTPFARLLMRSPSGVRPGGSASSAARTRPSASSCDQRSPKWAATSGNTASISSAE